MTSPPPRTAVATSLPDGACRALPATVIVLAVAVVMAPLSYWQHGRAGVCVLVAGFATIVLSFWLAAWLMKTFLHAGRMTAGVLAAAGLRMVLPLALVVVIVIGGRQLVPARTVIYLVPLYLSMLCAETVLAARRLGATRRQADAGQE